MSNRAQRRHHAERMKARAKRIYPHDPCAKNADHLAKCSCCMCGNPRRHFSGKDGLTVQERRAA